MRRNIDAWWPYIEEGVEAIVMTASGCGAMVRDYAHVLRHDHGYANKAARVTELTRDLSEILAGEDLGVLDLNGAGRRVAYHPPCTLQHGQKLVGVVEEILGRLNYALTPIADKHFCCGSAGTYSILQKALSQQLLKNKVAALESGRPDIIVSANIGCLLHIQTGTQIGVRHWIELLDVA
jgi:glycolate oxidase iron-sulfur subunit